MVSIFCNHLNCSLLRSPDRVIYPGYTSHNQYNQEHYHAPTADKDLLVCAVPTTVCCLLIRQCYLELVLPVQGK